MNGKMNYEIGRQSEIVKVLVVVACSCIKFRFHCENTRTRE